MRGITRACRHTLDEGLKRRWMAHLCGLCLALRDEAGQGYRLLTGYDLVLLSVLVEAQAGSVGTETAGRCPLRGMRTAAVVPANSPGARLAAAGSLLAGSAAVEDKVHDHDLPGWAAPLAGRWGRSVAAAGKRLSSETGLDGDVLARGARRAAAAEGAGGTLADLLAPSGEVVGELFAHTAVVAGMPANRLPLRRAGDAFGRLVHLIDAAEDYAADAQRGRFNPLASTATAPADARQVALDLAASVRKGLGEADLEDPQLAHALLGPTLERSVRRTFRSAEPQPPAAAERSTPERPAAAAAAAVGAMAAVAAAPAVMLGIFGRPGRRRPPYYGDPYGPPPGYGGYGYGRRGPSCCDMLACDCCANMACTDCCGGDDCCVCCC